MRRRWQSLLVCVVVGMMVGLPTLYSAHRQTEMRNLRVVEEGVLYRSGQLNPQGFVRVLEDCRIKTVVTLRTVRDPGRPFPDDWERVVCESRGLKHVRIIPRIWGPDEKGTVPAEEAVREFLQVMDDSSNYPVLVHCYAGIHRTGTMCAIFRLEYQQWNADRAIAEMQRYGFDPEDMHEHIEGYLRRYQPRAKARTLTPKP